MKLAAPNGDCPFYLPAVLLTRGIETELDEASHSLGVKADSVDGADFS